MTLSKSRIFAVEAQKTRQTTEINICKSQITDKNSAYENLQKLSKCNNPIIKHTTNTNRHFNGGYTDSKSHKKIFNTSALGKRKIKIQVWGCKSVAKCKSPKSEALGTQHQNWEKKNHYKITTAHLAERTIPPSNTGEDTETGTLLYLRDIKSQSLC